MNIYQHEETGRICEGYSPPTPRYYKIGQRCEKCGQLNRHWETSSYCSPCRADFMDRSDGIKREGRFAEC
jgi:hypothetical protein